MERRVGVVTITDCSEGGPAIIGPILPSSYHGQFYKCDNRNCLQVQFVDLQTSDQNPSCGGCHIGILRSDGDTCRSLPPIIDDYPGIGPVFASSYVLGLYECQSCHNEDAIWVPSCQCHGVAVDEFIPQCHMCNNECNYLIKIKNMTTTALNAVLATIKVTCQEYYEEEEDVICPVCMEQLFVIDDEKETRRLPCRHMYHSHCILQWLSNHNTCPVCRFQLPIPLH